jgi:hypothetical protein
MLPTFTILSPSDDPQEAWELIDRLTQRRILMQPVGEPEDWTAIRIIGAHDVVEVARRTRHTVGNDFFRTRLGVWHRFNQVETQFERVKYGVLKRIAFHQAAFVAGEIRGANAPPDSSNWLYQFAEELNAIIWDGAAVFDATGRLLLDSYGNSQVDPDA